MKLFKCPKLPEILALDLTKKACAKFYYVANRETYASQNRLTAIYEYCVNCEVGKNNLKEIGDKLPTYKKQSKICLLYQLAPDKCRNERYNGLFVRTRGQLNNVWVNKKYCCGNCGLIYLSLLRDGKIK